MTNSTKHPVKNEPIFKKFCSKKEIQDRTIRNYVNSLQKYSDFTGMTLQELIDEAGEEEEQRVRMINRKISEYLDNFNEDLKNSKPHERIKNQKTINPTYVKRIITQVRTFYKDNGIELPPTMRKGRRSDKKPETKDDLPTIQEISFFIDNCNITYKAIVVLGLSSGMSRAEIASLKFKHLYDGIGLEKYPKTLNEVIEALNNRKIEIPKWDIVRIKTNQPYFTFSSPESIDKIIDYLELLSTKHPDYTPKPEDTLLRTIKGNKPVTDNAMSSMFNRKSQALEIRRINRRSVIRPHTLRKYFATTLESNKIPHLVTRRLMGHTIDNTTSAYFRPDPETMKEYYIDAIDQLTTNKVQIKVIDRYEDVTKRMKDLENEIRIKDQIDGEKITNSLREKYKRNSENE